MSIRTTPKTCYDFHLILATTVVLFAISIICIYGMFYFKFVQVHEMPVMVKAAYMNRMNTFVAPFFVVLILLLGICVPKRLLPARWLNAFAVLLVVAAGAVSVLSSVKTALLLCLVASLILQVVVLVMACAGSQMLNFEKKGYWIRIGSSLVHLGLILFILDLFLYRHQTLHLVLFWVTTGSTVLGMLFCFYAEAVIRLIGRREGISQLKIEE